jgi:hypothetical protein
MTWPSERVTKTALWRAADGEDVGDTRRPKTRRETRRMVRAGTVRVPQQRRGGTR